MTNEFRSNLHRSNYIEGLREEIQEIKSLVTVNRKYTHIFFDLDNTIWDFEKNSKCAMKITFDHFELKKQSNFPDFFKTYTTHNRNLWMAYRQNTVSKKELILKRFQNTFQDLKIDGIDPYIMNSFYLNEMAKQKILVDGALELLDYLHKKKYALYIITNGFKEVQLKKIESAGLRPLFQKIFISEEIKTPKPGKAIFEYAIKSANARKKQSLMIGDDWESDIVGACNFGIDALYYTGNSEKNLQGNDSGKHNFSSVRSVSGLLDIKHVL